MQRCGRCKQEKDAEEFSPSYRGKTGTWCRNSFAAYARGEAVAATAHLPMECAQCGATYIPRHRKVTNRFCSPTCKANARVTSGRARNGHLLREYGITQDDYDRMLAEQGGGCGICGRTPEEQTRYSKYLHVDHDHATGAVRGLLCEEHNLLLGRWGDNTILLEKAIEYLKRKE